MYNIYEREVFEFEGGSTLKFNEKISKIMKDKNIKNVELAEKSGVSESSIRDIKTGRRSGTKNNIEKILSHLEITSEERKELMILWSFSKGDESLIDEFYAMKRENEELKTIIEKFKPEIDNVKKIEELEKKVEELVFFKGILELPEKEFREVANAIKEKLIYFAAIKGKTDLIKNELEEYDKMIKKMKK